VGWKSKKEWNWVAEDSIPYTDVHYLCMSAAWKLFKLVIAVALTFGQKLRFSVENKKMKMPKQFG